MADENVYIQNRDIGNNTTNYIAGFHAVNKVYCGKNVYQKYCNKWRDKEGDVIIDKETHIDMRGTEIVFTTGVSVTHTRTRL